MRSLTIGRGARLLLPLLIVAFMLGFMQLGVVLAEDVEKVNVEIKIKGAASEQEIFAVGDAVTFLVKADKACYVYVLDEGTSGTVRWLFPNKCEGQGNWAEVDNQVQPNTEIEIPPSGSKCQYKVEGPTSEEAGKKFEKIVVYASPTKITSLEELKKLHPAAVFGEKVDQPNIKDLNVELRGMKNDLSSASVKFWIEGGAAADTKPAQ
jgi:hypothetical protein